ncbi:MAG: hypothetical protein IPP71_22135 [Bacteroidetes bacterium]|nr:hypothetical protein [Bacteroidota bacterium]
MLLYLARRLLLFIPTLVVISLLAFIISRNAPGDPVERMISVATGEGMSTQNFSENTQRDYWRTKLGLDLPVFYFAIKPLSEPSWIYTITDKGEKESVQRLSQITGNNTTTSHFHKARMQLIHTGESLLKTISDSVKALLFELNGLKYASSAAEIEFRIQRINELAK